MITQIYVQCNDFAWLTDKQEPFNLFGIARAIADERLYGSFIYNSEIPNALFFMSSIKNGDDFELRKALRNHDIDTIVSASPSGSVWLGHER